MHLILQQLNNIGPHLTENINYFKIVSKPWCTIVNTTTTTTNNNNKNNNNNNNNNNNKQLGSKKCLRINERKFLFGQGIIEFGKEN
ncbi:unnamed protein product [Schistosoma margrebowiei]|uniref:Uncharacterized protein n=1 Tax=Schistosoma margrebowiei TaxID=48269 RepID=A0A183LIH2_9TREM|nr:unnamed protein product [Schistosoma margrebowiei]